MENEFKEAIRKAIGSRIVNGIDSNKENVSIEIDQSLFDEINNALSY